MRAYLACDDTGAPLIPAIRQRPILLMGPPGVGKTHIVKTTTFELEGGCITSCERLADEGAEG